jgi:hypothetical protein
MFRYAGYPENRILLKIYSLSLLVLLVSTPALMLLGNKKELFLCCVNALIFALGLFFSPPVAILVCY